MGEEVDRELISAAASLMGSRRSARKTQTCRENGLLGGGSRPRVFSPCESGKPHRWRDDRCRFCGQAKAALRLKD